jgi:hypothetical protein
LIDLFQIIRTDEELRKSNTYRLIFQLGIADSMHLVVHIFSAIFSWKMEIFSFWFCKVISLTGRRQSKHKVFLQLLGAVIQCGWFLQAFMTAALAINRFAQIVLWNTRLCAITEKPATTVQFFSLEGKQFFKGNNCTVLVVVNSDDRIGDSTNFNLFLHTNNVLLEVRGF